MGRVIHGMRGTRLYNIWVSAGQRCNNPNAKDYPRYGGRGIKIDPAWNNFVNFMSEMKPAYDQHVREYGEFDTQLDRIDNDREYSAANCRWVTIVENLNNRTNYAKVGTNGRKINLGKRWN